jgi:hypothetical protein
MLFTFFLLVWGLTGDSPFACEGDEEYCVGPALEMLRRGDLNPHWFAHPASTTIYPLYFYYQFLNALVFHGTLASPSTCTENLIFDHVYLLCYLPRYMNVMLVVCSLPLLYLIGRSIFGNRAALFALPFFSISPLLLEYVQVIRSEAPALFFSLLAIYLSLKLYKNPTLPLHILIGISIGLGVSSRFPMLALMALFLVVDLGYAFKASQLRLRLKYLCYAAIGLFTVVLTFAVTTPFLFLDFRTFLHDMAVERAAHGLGCDGLSTLGNLDFYVRDAIPRLFFPVQTVLALAGMLIALARRKYDAALLIVYFTAILVGTCLHPFHTDKWVIPNLPILALFAGYSLDVLLSLVDFLMGKVMHAEIAKYASVVISLLLIVYLERQPFLACCVYNTIKIGTSTEPLFYQWVFGHLAPGTKICVVGGVWGGGHRERFQTKDFLYDPSYFDAECSGKYVSPSDLYNQGFKYFICSNMHYPVYQAEPAHYPRESRFFNEFFDNCKLIKELAPDKLSVGGLFDVQQRGATFRLYEFTPKTKMP